MPVTTVADSANPLPSDAISARKPALKAILVACSGNVVEWFDFFAYAFTALYFAPAFFPAGDPTSQLLNTAGIFAAGFLMRPVGGWLFGRIADRRGRRKSMVISVFMMCFGSLMIAVLPTYAQIGAWSSLLLLLARLLQGLSVGGEYGTSATYLSEVATPGRRGFYGSFHYATIIAGQLLAVLVVAILQSLLTTEELRHWGWRVPFALGAVGAVVAMVVRRAMHESSSSAHRAHPLAGTIRGMLQHPRELLMVLGFTGGGSLLFYTTTSYMQKYMVNTAHMNPKMASSVMTGALFIFMCVQPLFGMLSDRIGRRPQMIAFSLFFIGATVPLMTVIGTNADPWKAFGLVLVSLLGMSLYTSISGLLKAELFPAGVRAMGVGLPYAIANAAFGGTAEYVALWLKSRGIESTFFWYVSAMSVVLLICSMCLRRAGEATHLDERK
ncbi:TPA: MFS transporter [Burkholderia aenigmatica]|uniref:MFS family transporter n=1 Tax=Burkholderia sp. AU45251 TaxID=3059204 RepID=UPI00264BEEDA|nr:MFS family transporter [Burkholderia sp. AU45251]HDR9482500.1 MFS transporter [Burkholderia aenigmatica]MDN7514860.1 MFS family transporter [Burkholderia sp. AU45251]HDR9514806.1 MFS transporter [Burkholderia aenigmatica]HDR9590871.1 MFS transporter [Burkholderia aenigmatica]HDR9602789.1 MFS transporter [Burkholderia aenigmatica]